jgi:hypothetical protein
VSDGCFPQEQMSEVRWIGGTAVGGTELMIC